MKVFCFSYPVLLGLFILVCSAIFPGELGHASDIPNRPNILVIISDDQRYDAMGEFMPYTQSKIFDEGVNFSQAYVTTPACCPSRSSIFTGMYARRHKVVRNSIPLQKRTFMQALEDAGYFTGMVGKYLNSWDGSPRPEFNFWSVFPGGSSTYINPEIYINGVLEKQTGYMTDILRDEAIKFFDLASQQSDPFLLVFAPNAPHSPATPSIEDRNAYADLQPYRPTNYNVRAARTSLPTWLSKKKLLSKSRQRSVDRYRLRQLRSLLSLDRAIQAMIEKLENSGQLENTLIIYISDNGVLYGEHGLESKDCVYEPAIHVPFAVRHPNLIEGGRVAPQLVANIDIAPTIFELVGLPRPSDIDGLSLMPILKEEKISWRQEIMIEGHRNIAGRAPFTALHGSRYVFVENKDSKPEFYDLELDPQQLINRVNDATYANQVTEMRARLNLLKESIR